MSEPLGWLLSVILDPGFPSQEELDASLAALERMDARKDEDPEEWANKLGEILGKFTD